MKYLMMMIAAAALLVGAPQVVAQERPRVGEGVGWDDLGFDYQDLETAFAAMVLRDPPELPLGSDYKVLVPLIDQVEEASPDDVSSVQAIFRELDFFPTLGPKVAVPVGKRPRLPRVELQPWLFKKSDPSTGRDVPCEAGEARTAILEIVATDEMGAQRREVAYFASMFKDGRGYCNDKDVREHMEYHGFDAHRMWMIFEGLKPRSEMEYLAAAYYAGKIFKDVPNPWWRDGYSYRPRHEAERSLNRWAFSHFAGNPVVSRYKATLLFVRMFPGGMPAKDLVMSRRGILMTSEMHEQWKQLASSKGYHGYLKEGDGKLFAAKHLIAIVRKRRERSPSGESVRAKDNAKMPDAPNEVAEVQTSEVPRNALQKALAAGSNEGGPTTPEALPENAQDVPSPPMWWIVVFVGFGVALGVGVSWVVVASRKPKQVWPAGQRHAVNRGRRTP